MSYPRIFAAHCLTHVLESIRTIHHLHLVCYLRIIRLFSATRYIAPSYYFVDWYSQTRQSYNTSCADWLEIFAFPSSDDFLEQGP